MALLRLCYCIAEQHVKKELYTNYIFPAPLLAAPSLLLVGRRQGFNYVVGGEVVSYNVGVVYYYNSTSPTILTTKRNTGISTRFLRILI